MKNKKPRGTNRGFFIGIKNMKKVTKIIFAIVSLLVLIIGVAWWMLTSTTDTNKPCAFCDPILLQTHTFYEDETVRCLCSHKPLEPGHCLIVPKRHIERFEETSEEEISAIGR